MMFTYFKGKFCWLFDQVDRVPLDLRTALNVGNTLVTRLWLALLSLSLGAQLATGQPSIFSHPNYRVFDDTYPMWLWSLGLVSAGLLMMWRVLTKVPRPLFGWTSNVLTLFVWVMVVVSRIAVMGWSSVGGWPTVVMIMAAWVLVRTEATRRDGETA